MRGRKHTAETQAQVMAALLAGQGVNEVSREYDLPKATVSRLKSSLTHQELERIGTKKGEEIEVLLFDYLSATLRTLKIQAEIVSEREYVLQQPADSLAVLHGVMADKSIRLLEAAERARAASPQPSTPALQSIEGSQ